MLEDKTMQKSYGNIVWSIDLLYNLCWCLVSVTNILYGVKYWKEIVALQVVKSIEIIENV